MSTEKKRLIAYVGRNHVDRFEGGGISVFEISADGSSITPLAGGVEDMPKRAGYLAYAPKARSPLFGRRKKDRWTRTQETGLGRDVVQGRSSSPER